MKNRICLLLACFFMAAVSFAKDVNEREPFDLYMAVSEEQYFAAKIEKSWYVVKERSVQLVPGEKVYVEADLDGNVLTKLKRVERIKNPEKTLTIEFKQICDGKKHKMMMLYIENPFPKKLNYSARVCLLKYGRWVDTSVIDVENSSYETWTDLISSIALENFNLVD